MKDVYPSVKHFVYFRVCMCLTVPAVASLFIYFLTKCGRKDKNRLKPQWQIRRMSFRFLKFQKHLEEMWIV